MPTKTKPRTHKVRTLAEAKRLEDQIRGIREAFEQQERSSGFSRITEDDEAAFEIERQADARIQTATRNANDLFTLLEQRILPRLDELEAKSSTKSTKTSTADDGKPESREAAEQKTRAAELLAKAGIDLSDDASEDMRKVTAIIAQQQREIDLLVENRSSRLGLSGYDGTRAANDPETKFSLTRAVQGHLANWEGWDNAYPEKDLIAEYRQKAMEAGVPSTGGFLVAPTWVSDLIELLRPNTVAMQLGMRTLPNLTGGPVQFAKLKGGATAYWVAEGKKATKSEMTMGMLNLTPRPIIGVVPISEDLLEAAPNASGVVEEDLAQAIGEAIDRGVMNGGGGEGQPLGIVNSPGIGKTDWSGATFPTATDYSGSNNFQTVTDLLDDMIFQVAARNAYKGSLGFALNPLAVQKLRTIKDHSGRPLLFNASAMNPNAGESASVALSSTELWGHAFGMSTELLYGAVTDLIFGNWADLLLGRWGATKVVPSIHASDYGAADGATNAFLQRQVWVRMSAKVDCGLRHGESMQIANGWAN